MNVLQGERFQGLNRLMENLPYYFSTGLIRGAHYTHRLESHAELHKLNIDELKNLEALALFRDLAFASAAFYHARNADPIENLPRCYAVPLHELSKRFGVRPTLSYFLYAQANCYAPNPGRPFSLDNARTIRHFVSVMDEEWFIIIHAVIEDIFANFGKTGIKKVCLCLERNDKDYVLLGFRNINFALNEIYKVFLQMPLGCNPHVYFKEVRPQIMPFKNLIYNGVAELEEKPQSFVAGETGAQSTIMPILDAFTGTKHAPTDGFNFVREMRNYMPRRELQLIESLERGPSVKEFVVGSGIQLLAEEFDNIVLGKHRFRQLHYRYAQDYIFQFKELTPQDGTGGTPASKWLKQMEEETLDNLIDKSRMPTNPA